MRLAKKDSYYRKVRKGFAKIAKLIICILTLCNPCDFIFAILAVIISDFLECLIKIQLINLLSIYIILKVVKNDKSSTPPRKNGAGCYKRGGFGF
jgi:hypothetical protein